MQARDMADKNVANKHAQFGVSLTEAKPRTKI